VNTQGLFLSMGIDFSSLNFICAEVTLSLLFTVNVPFSHCLIVPVGVIFMLLNTPSLMGW
jgi:hypothetical protein